MFLSCKSYITTNANKKRHQVLTHHTLPGHLLSQSPVLDKGEHTAARSFTRLPLILSVIRRWAYTGHKRKNNVIVICKSDLYLKENAMNW